MKSARTASALVAGLVLIATLPAQAQVWNYSPYTGTSGWLSLARGLSYPLNRLSGGYMPFYLGSNLIYGASYAATQGFRNNARNYNYGNYDPNTNTYNDQEPYYDPRQRTRPNYAGGYGSDQVVHANWKKQQQQQQDEDNVPVPQAQQQQNQNDWLNQPIQPGGTSLPPQAVANEGAESMPPTAPQLAHHAQGKASEPLAMGFVQVVNERYNGDLALALRDKDMRKYAHSVGLMDSDKTPSDNISRDKADLIRAILADRSESASVKINAVRVLLKH